MSWLQKIPLLYILLFVLLLGLAPFTTGILLYMTGALPVLPEPHIVEKFRMLSSGALQKPLDIFDLLMHATPWVLLVLKLVSMAGSKQAD